MEKHITLVAILNIVYRSLMLAGAMVLFALAMGFGGLIDYLIRSGEIGMHEVPLEVLHIIPAILCIIGLVLAAISILGIVGGIGLMKQKEWGRVLLLVVSFFNLLHIPLGTCLGVYSLWVLMNDETIRFIARTNAKPAPAAQS